MSQILKPKKGYKKVKGLFGKYEEIPQEWKIKEFDEIFEFLLTGTNPRSDLGESGDIQYIHYGDIHTKWKSILDCNSAEIPWISKTKVEKIPHLQEGDLIIVDVSEDYDGSGTSILLKNVKNKKVVSGLHTFALRNKNENVSLDFKAYLTSIKFVKNQIIGYVTGVSVYGLSKKNVKKIRIPLPTIQEQQKIATILFNVDNFIFNTQKIIDQTKSLKQGLMQKLLTKGIGHKKFKKEKFGLRFIIKEIPEEWSVKQIDIVCKSIVSGRNKPKNFDGDIPWITIEDLDNFFIKKSKLNLKVSKIEIKQFGGKIIPKNSVIMSCVGEFGIIGINENEVVLNQQLHAFQCLNYITPYFLALFLSTMKNYMDSVSTMTTVAYLNKNNCGSILIAIPPLSEQQKISIILSNVDSQIQSQIQYKEKLESLKKSLMQKLLTGQVRVTV